MSNPGAAMFRALRSHDFRVWWAGTLVSNVGTWMQRTAQDWLVLAELTHRDATAVGVVMGLQYAPQLLLLPWTGSAADHLDRRRLLMATQALMAVLGLGLGLLTVTGLVRLWQVDLFALLSGCVTAFDGPARQVFVSDLVDDADLPNAVALNSTSFNAARMVGPALAGVTIAALGTGWAFLVNGVSFLAVLLSLRLLRTTDLRGSHRAAPARGGFMEGFRYVRARANLKAVLLMLFLIGTFGLNFPIFISTMAVTVFHAGAGQYGLLSSAMAVGTLLGALGGARRAEVRFGHLLTGAALFGAGCALAAVMPTEWLFAGALVMVGMAALTFTNASNSLMQISTEPGMRGRVMALRLAVALGGTPVGAPFVG